MPVTKWALLCGGDFYLPPPETEDLGNNLSGCVSDVKAIYAVLIKNGVRRENIKMLTASCGTENPLRPQEEPHQWPTWNNIRRELDNIKQQANRGDLVYFHYSGHGCLRDNKDDTSGGIPNGSALFMTDVLQGGAYLTVRHLGMWLQDMVTDKVIRVTVVLDSCHSGAAFRNDNINEGHIRFLEGPGTRDVDRAADKECDYLGQEIIRDPKDLRPCWLSNPTNCTVLTACGPDEVAREVSFEGRKHGVLTYWLLDLLKSSSARLPSYGRTLDHVQQKIHTRFPKQTPQAFGDMFYEFFGYSSYKQVETCLATRTASERRPIDLNVGRNQGVAKGAVFRILRNDEVQANEQSLQSPPLMVTVSAVFDFTCEATFTQEGDNHALQNWPIDGTRRAALEHWALREDVYVHAEFLHADTSKREELCTELAKTPGLKLFDKKHQHSKRQDHHGDIDFTLNNGPEGYEILQNNVALRRVPKIKISDMLWAVKLSRILSHIARFQELRRQYKDFEPSLKLAKNDFELSASPKSVKSGKSTRLALKYFGEIGPQELWVSVFCFSESWAIYKVHPSLGHAAERNFFEGWRRGLEVSTFVPRPVNDGDPEEVHDLFVFFVATLDANGAPISWGNICLPPLKLEMSHSEKEESAPEEDHGGREPRIIETELDRLPEWAAIHTSVRTFP